MINEISNTTNNNNKYHKNVVFPAGHDVNIYDKIHTISAVINIKTKSLMKSTDVLFFFNFPIKCFVRFCLM